MAADRKDRGLGSNETPRAPLRLLIAGGGTGGHVLPALAVVEELRERDLPLDLHWIGSHTGVEAESAERAAIPFTAIETGKLRRYPSLRTLTDAGRIPVGVVQARRAVSEFRPDVVLSTGGFVSVPTVLAAKGIAPVVTHEQTAILGLATRIDAKVAVVLAVSWDATGPAARAIHRRVVVTGNPVRRSLLDGNAARGFAAFGFDPTMPLLYVTGGARGASPINSRIAELLPGLLEGWQVLHQTGPETANSDLADLRARQRTWPDHLQSRYRAVDFLRDDLADVYAAASAIIGRAGAGTVAELTVLGVPSILIPLPGAGGDEQTRNARLLADAGGAILLPQDEATPERLQRELDALLASPERRSLMSAAARRVGKPDAAANLADVLLSVARR
jgi:UDP-N-acetylglucosamine--N-acetylmuramyl-(pentapeptide) pyrophosphoryl-undecaprenol N-acetylglucosamine transferase